MKSSLKQNLRIIRNLTLTDFKLKYNRNILGFFWSLLKPLLMLATLYLVFHILMRLDVPHYELFLLLGIILWSFFTEATTYSMSAILRNSNLIKKTMFERKLIVISATLSALITLVLNLMIFFIFLAFAGVYPSRHFLLFLFALLELVIFTLGISFFLSAVYVRFRDLNHIWEVIAQILFWLTPIIYPISIVSEKYRNIFILNPLARIIEDSRNALIFHTLPPLDLGYAKHVGITLIICVGALLLGIWVFNKKSHKFAENV